MINSGITLKMVAHSYRKSICGIKILWIFIKEKYALKHF